MGGAAAVALTEPQLPSHGHTPMGAAGHDAAGPSGNTWGTLEGGRSGSPAYFSGTPDKTMSSAAIDPAGSTSPNPHNNLQPYLAVNFIISTEGEFPSRG
jgi:microcystin-dependent protein